MTPEAGPDRWLRESVLYQIYPQSFADANGDGIGDLAGIIARLDYLAWLGVNLVWLSPCFTSPFRDAGYDVSDYLTIAPRYGTNDDLVELVEQAGRRGIRVMLDLVVGHTSDQHPWFRAAGDDPTDHRYIWSPTPAPSTVAGQGRRGGFFLTNFLPCQPALNFGYARSDPTQPWREPVTAEGPRANRAMIREVMAHWLDRGVAGFRCDMAYSLVKDDPDRAQTSAVWREVRAWLDQRRPQAALISEWGQPDLALAAGFHADFFLSFNGPVLRSLWDDRTGTVRNPDEPADPPALDPLGRGSLRPFQSAWASLDGARGTVVLPSANHDFTRLAATDRSDAQLATAFALLLTLPTVPAIYYGDEIGQRFQPDVPDKEGSKLGPTSNRGGSRTPMQWDSTRNAGFSTAPAEQLYLPIDPRDDRPTVAAQRADPASLLHTVRSLIALRRREPALRSGPFDLLHASNPIAFRRGAFLVAVNPANVPVSMSIPTGAPILHRGCRIEDGQLRLAAFGFGIYRVDADPGDGR
jgi:maltose alpha-D-glucosyltransferase/alpha-amylase